MAAYWVQRCTASRRLELLSLRALAVAGIRQRLNGPIMKEWAAMRPGMPTSMAMCRARHGQKWRPSCSPCKRVAAYTSYRTRWP
eukprot:5748311-Alexandrium_andersonii.AAC.1